MRVLLNRTVDRFVRKANLGQDAICKAAAALLSGRWDADLGGGLYKQRVARAGKGKSGGYRFLLVLRLEDTVFFLFAFAKSDKENLTLGELHRFRKISTDYRMAAENQIRYEVEHKYLVEVHCHGETISK